MKNAWVSRVGMITLVGVLVLVGDAYAEKGKDKHAPPPAPVAMPRVVDANNILVGEVVGVINQTVGIINGTGVDNILLINAVVALNIPEPSIVAQVRSNRFIGNARLFFTDSTCVGQPYFNSDDLNAPHIFSLVGFGKENNSTLYQPRANSTPVAVAIVWMWDYDNTCKTHSLSQTSGIIADPIIDLSTLFTPPYRFVYP